MKKIAFFDIYDPIPLNSGGDWYRYQLLKSFNKYGEVTEYYTKKIENKCGITPQNITFNRILLKSKFNWNKVSKKLEMIQPELILNKSQIKDIKADVVFTIAELYHIGNYIAKKNHAPLVLLMHNIEWEYLKNIKSLYWIPMKFYENYIIKKVYAIVGISERDCDYAKLVSKKDNVFIIPPKINRQIFNPDGPRFDFGNDKLNILFYGSLNREQNIEAIRLIKHEIIPKMKNVGQLQNTCINIFGSGKPPNDLNLERDPDITFFGEVENPAPYIRGTDVVLVPVRNPCGLKMRIIESLACGKLVISTPEAVNGLSSDLKKKVIICQDSDAMVSEISNLIGKDLKQYNVKLDDEDGESFIKMLYDYINIK